MEDDDLTDERAALLFEKLAELNRLEPGDLVRCVRYGRGHHPVGFRQGRLLKFAGERAQIEMEFFGGQKIRRWVKRASLRRVPDEER